jgi:excisionase family DNA binding protein
MATMGVKDVAERYSVGEKTVLGWIHEGTLPAINCGRRMGHRPKWRITSEALTAFEQTRSSRPTPKPAPVRRQRDRAEVIEFIR